MLNNSVKLVGTVIGDIEKSHVAYGEEFYTLNIGVKRRSGCLDTLPVIVSWGTIHKLGLKDGSRVLVIGTYRSRNVPKPNSINSKLVLYVFADELTLTDIEEDVNEVELIGFICKDVRYRETPRGKQITDVLLAVNRRTRKTDYIPAIVWGRLARFISMQEVGVCMNIKGRLQSREYTKTCEDGTLTNGVVYEVSANQISIIEDK